MTSGTTSLDFERSRLSSLPTLPPEADAADDAPGASELGADCARAALGAGGAALL